MLSLSARREISDLEAVGMRGVEMRSYADHLVHGMCFELRGHVLGKRGKTQIDIAMPAGWVDHLQCDVLDWLERGSARGKAKGWRGAAARLVRKRKARCVSKIIDWCIVEKWLNDQGLLPDSFGDKDRVILFMDRSQGVRPIEGGDIDRSWMSTESRLGPEPSWDGRELREMLMGRMEEHRRKYGANPEACRLTRGQQAALWSARDDPGAPPSPPIPPIRIEIIEWDDQGVRAPGRGTITLV